MGDELDSWQVSGDRRVVLTKVSVGLLFTTFDPLDCAGTSGSRMLLMKMRPSLCTQDTQIELIQLRCTEVK